QPQGSPRRPACRTNSVGILPHHRIEFRCEFLDQQRFNVTSVRTEFQTIAYQRYLESLMKSARPDGPVRALDGLATEGDPMRIYKSARVLSITTSLFLLLVSAPLALAQQNTPNPQDQGAVYRTGVRSVPSGQKTKLKGRIIRRDAETFSIRDDQDMETVVRLT